MKKYGLSLGITLLTSIVSVNGMMVRLPHTFSQEEVSGQLEKVQKEPVSHAAIAAAFREGISYHRYTEKDAENDLIRAKKSLEAALELPGASKHFEQMALLKTDALLTLAHLARVHSKFIKIPRLFSLYARCFYKAYAVEERLRARGAFTFMNDFE